MNKIKVLYDVVRTMKKKEMINGIINFEVLKGETKLITFINEFSRNTVSGDVKAKISKEIDIDGKKVKSESNSEFNMKDCPHHKFHHGMHMQQHGHMLSKAQFILSALNNLKVEEKEDKNTLSLDLKELIKEGKEIGTEFGKNNEHCEDKDNFGPHRHHEFMKQFLSSEYENATLDITVNKNNEVETIEITANGENNINGSLNFNW